jgi:TPP-dependent pyruvate/acetoin dehydrogenase alpha subunit
MMLLSRLLDDKTITLYKQNKCHFQISCAGHEGIQVAAAKVFRAGQDWLYPYYRDMALVVGMGMTSEEIMMNAMNKAQDPNSHGRMMPMHYCSLPLRTLVSTIGAESAQLISLLRSLLIHASAALRNVPGALG